MNKNVTALALAVASLGAQEAFATVAQYAVTAVATVQIGCTAPSAAGATVYSVDAYSNNALGQSDTIVLPTGVSAGANCSYALNQLSAATSVAGSATAGRWVSAGAALSTGTAPFGSSPVNITIPGSGYSLVTYTFVAQ